MKARITSLIILGVVLGAPASRGADWLQFRGNDSRAVAARTKLPIEWGEGRNLAWTAELPGRGLSSPIIIGNRVVLTASSGFRQDRLHVLCFDVSSGKKLWERQFWATGQTRSHPKTCMAAPTPASDGRRIFAFFSCNDLFCLDLEGNLLWLRGLTHENPNASNAVGMSSSPLVVGETLVLQVENDSDSFAAGIDVETGTDRWRIERPAKVNWTSPVALGAGGPAPTVVLQSTTKVTGHDPRYGHQLWEYSADSGAIPSTTVAGGVLYIPAKGLTAMRIGDSSKPEVLWSSERLRLSTPCAVVHDGRAHVLNGNILKCAGTDNGKVLWQLRLKGPFSSTPVLAGDHLYCFSESGLGQVVWLGGEKGEVVATSDLGETVLCTPAVGAGALFVRSDGHLWKIAEK